MRIEAVILAAGASSRMAAPKPLVARGGVSLLDEAAAPFIAVGARVVVVTGFHADLVEPYACALPAVSVRNTAPARGMASSVRTGLRRTFGADVVFVQPVDCPGVRPHTVAMLVAALNAVPGAHAAIPLFQGRRGHPVALDRFARAMVLRARRHASLRDALARLGPSVVAVETDDPAVLTDLDTPEDVARWRGVP